ncbi:PilZ domain-containing protein [Desulforamulus ruminis]|uniref:Type IV pilus assembly PilZ n=1 Tax=Desulforamulus ruminis (strain ATCC 23193 / DSM 2154 / NCIMB 8452 / DL) TaxID=696281 RepID=F6DPU7_DESRL|nr:PilZ domain-containing protein [Desulforamulus ruminis]AEG60786.1 type IV pilus assembly PilZ [Desulforamulus ruminis DSM 2154]
MKDRREYPRIETDWVVRMVSAEDERELSDIKIMNVGGGGISFLCTEELQTGEKFLIHLPFISIYIYIIWQHENRYGAMFVNPLGDEVELLCQHIYSQNHS